MTRFGGLAAAQKFVLDFVSSHRFILHLGVSGVDMLCSSGSLSPWVAFQVLLGLALSNKGPR